MDSRPTPRCREDLILREIDDELVVYDPVTDHTALLNRSAALAFSLCDGTRAPSEIVREVARVYGVEEDDVRTDIEHTLEDFFTRGFFVNESAES